MIEFSSYEGNENNNDNNRNEEYFINKNIIDFQNKNIKIKQNEKEEKNFENKNEKYKSEIPFIKENIEEENLNTEKKRTGVIQLNNFKINKNNNIVDNNKGEIVNSHKNKLTISLTNKEKIEKEKEKQLSSQKGAMKILQLLISKKHEKEENDKKKEEYLIKNFKKAINNIEIDVFSEKNLLKENKTKNVSNQEKVEEKIIMNENNKNQNEVNNELIFNSNINKINNDKVYVKNTKKIPYRKLKINSNKKNENKIKENKDEFHIENSSQINRYKNIKNIYSYYIYNTNPSSNEIIENKKQQTPYNDYVESLQQISQRNKRKIYNREDHSMILPKNAFNSIENSFDITTVYKKRNIHNKNLMGNNSPLSSKIYSYKKPINKRKNSYEKYDPNRPNNYDINEIIKNKKNNKDMFKSYLLNKKLSYIK